MDETDLPCLAPGVRLHQDAARGWVLLSPEQVTELDGPAPCILRLCDGRRAVAGIVSELLADYPGACAAQLREDVLSFLHDLALQRLLVTA